MTQVFAHRGAHSRERENTLGAFRDALDIGVDGVELDVRRTLDGVLVVHHDPDANGSVIALARATDLPSYVPRLDEALDVLIGVRVNVEVKNLVDPKEPAYDETGEFASAVIEALHARAQRDVLEVSCFDLATCRALRACDPVLPIALLTWRTALLEALELASDAGLSAVNPHYLLVDEVGQARAGELGLDLNVWTVNDAPDLLSMAHMGVASVITDQPELAMRLLHSADGPM